MKKDAIDKTLESYLQLGAITTREEYESLLEWERMLYLAYWTKKKYDGYPLQVMSLYADGKWVADESVDDCMKYCLYRIDPDVLELSNFLEGFVRKSDSESITYNDHFLLELCDYIKNAQHAAIEREKQG